MNFCQIPADKMDVDTATKFIASLTKSLQAVLHGCLDFEKDIELGGYVYLRVDSAQRVDYILSEKMQKSDLNSMTFLSNSFHASPQPGTEQNRLSQERDSSYAPSGNLSATMGRSQSSDVDRSRFTSSQSSTKSSNHQPSSSSGSGKRADGFVQPQDSGDDIFHIATTGIRWPMSSPSKKSSGITAPDFSRSGERSQSLTDFQTAFHNSPASFTSQSLSASFHQNGNGARSGAGQAGSRPQMGSLGHQQSERSGILPDPNDMEVVHIKTEEEDEVFGIPLHCQQGDGDGPPGRGAGKPPWLAMKMQQQQQPFYFPYHRLARSQSWDRRLGVGASPQRFPLALGNEGGDASLTCKVCGKQYRSRQGLLFHERAKHQKVFNVYCPVCGKGFQQSTHMQGHMATHTNVKHFQCRACGARYAHKTSLQQHIRSGSCRASAHLDAGNPVVGLDLSTSQIFRDIAPFAIHDEQARAAGGRIGGVGGQPSHSPLGVDFSQGSSGVGQRPLGMDVSQGRSQGQMDGEQGLGGRQQSSMSHSDMSSPEYSNPSFNDDERFDHPTSSDPARNIPESSMVQSRDRDCASDLSADLLSSSTSQLSSLGRTNQGPALDKGQIATSVSGSGNSREDDYSGLNTGGGGDVERVGGDGVGGGEMSVADSHPLFKPVNHEDMYEPDTDTPGTVPLSLSADDDD